MGDTRQATDPLLESVHASSLTSFLPFIWLSTAGLLLLFIFFVVFYHLLLSFPLIFSPLKFLLTKGPDLRCLPLGTAVHCLQCDSLFKESQQHFHIKYKS